MTEDLPSQERHAPVIVGDASAMGNSDGQVWTIGTKAFQLKFDGRAGQFRLVSFLNQTCEPALEYVATRAATSPFALTTAGDDKPWALSAGCARRVVAGGRPAVQLDLILDRPDSRAQFHVLVFPGTAIFRMWCEMENTGSGPLALKDFSWSIPTQAGNGAFADLWIGDGKIPAWHSPLHRAEITETYQRRLDGAKTGAGVPWVALHRTTGARDGWFLMLEYLGKWQVGVNRQAGGEIVTSAGVTDLEAVTLSPGERLQLPLLTLGVFTGSLDDMTARVFDWQYEYLWDYTHHDWHARILFCGSDYYNNAFNSQENFAGRVGWLDLETADLIRTLGAEGLWDDAGWANGDVWVGGSEGPDFAVTQRYLAKMGIKWTLWFCGRPARGIMDHKAAAWGNFQWRTDAAGEIDFKIDSDWRAQIRHFLEANPRSSFHTCDGGSGYSHSFDIQRFTDVNYFSDGGRPDLSNHTLSYFETPDKWLDIITSYTIAKSSMNTGQYDPDRYNEIYTMTPCFVCPGPQGVKWADPAAIQRITDTYRYLRDQGVAGRWSYMLHPAVQGDAEHFYSQRLSHDRKRAMIILKHRAPGTVTIFPTGLLPGHSYVVGYESHRETTSRTGADLMAQGIILADQPPVELIYLGLPNRPRSGTDTTPPRAPSRVLARREANIGRPGIGIYWSPGADDNWVTCYEIRRGDRVLDRIATGTYYFVHQPGWDGGATYSVRTNDGDGNAS